MADLKRHEELVVITKTYDLILWSCNHTGKFPRNHRFLLGERIERNLYDLLETLIQAKYTKQRQPLLERANLMLEILRFQMRLAKDLQCLKVESYGFAAKAIDEIGNLVGGWLNNQTSIVRCANPNRNVPKNRNNNVGFRPASTLPCRNPQALPCGACQGAKSKWSSRVGPSQGGSAE
jgi:hypothetical protein